MKTWQQWIEFLREHSGTAHISGTDIRDLRFHVERLLEPSDFKNALIFELRGVRGTRHLVGYTARLSGLERHKLADEIEAGAKKAFPLYGQVERLEARVERLERVTPPAGRSDRARMLQLEDEVGRLREMLAQIAKLAGDR